MENISLPVFADWKTVAGKKVKLSVADKFIFYQSPPSDKIYVAEIIPFPPPQKTTLRQQTVKKKTISPFQHSQNNDQQLVLPRGNYKINSPIIIPEGLKVKIEKGATLDFTNNSFFLSYSPVQFIGDSLYPILITSSDSSARGISVVGAKEISQLKWVKFSGLNTMFHEGWQYTGGVNFYESPVEINYCQFEKSVCEDALNIVRSEFSMHQSSISTTFGDGMDGDFCSGIIAGCQFSTIGNDALDFSGSSVKIENCTVTKAKDKGISIGENSTATVFNTLVSESNIAISSKDWSEVTISNSSFSDCNTAIAIFQKKPEYGPAKIIGNNVEFNTIANPNLIDLNSILILDGKEERGTEKIDVEGLYL